MTSTLIYSSRQVDRQPLSYTKDMRDYILASKLIDAIIMASKEKKRLVVVDRTTFTYIPSDGSRKMIIRLKRFK